MARNMRNFTLCCLLFCLWACKKKEETPSGILNPSDKFAVCNSSLAECTNGTGDYCLFGYKWGAKPSFSPAGFDAIGPQETGGKITFSFQGEGQLVNTHAQIDLPSRSFDNVLSCAQVEIRNALNAWAAAANIEFEELPENSPSQIRFFVADIRQSGVGYPNFTTPPCNAIGGDVVIKTNVNIQDCNFFYLFAMHEIGHALGLGHVNSANVMNPKFQDFNVTALQSGDLKGIEALYGAK
ncbi:MAG TPA: hypothetical protein DCS93_22220 [Microscillaceae bacterium]|nr:hypothetical protein [Microscillaceae bacterium]